MYASLPTVQPSKSEDCRKHYAVSLDFETNCFSTVLGDGRASLSLTALMFSKGPGTSLTDCQPTKWQEELPTVGVIIANK